MTPMECAKVFLNFVKRKYPLRVKVEVNFYDEAQLYLKDQNLWVGGYTTQNAKGIVVDIARSRLLAAVFETIAHEHKHCLQIQDGTWTENGFLSADSELEVEAQAFATQLISEWEEHCKGLKVTREEKLVVARVRKEELKAADLLIEKYREFRQAHPDCDLLDDYLH